MRRGISPILASVIIIAVTLVIAIGVIGWVMGLWGGFGTTESLQIYPDSYAKIPRVATNIRIYLHVKNTGSTTLKITKIEISGLPNCVKDDKTWVLEPGEEAILKNNGGKYSPNDNINLYKLIWMRNCQLVPGATYQIKVYTEAGNVYMGVLKVKPQD